MDDLYELFMRTVKGKYIEIEENTASYRTERAGETLYLFFEKSNGATDWKNNLDFPAKPYRQMKDLWFVHRGFLRVFKTLERRLAPLIFDPKIKRIIISGYSHGAALALLFHEYCVFNRPDLANRIFGYGFGCPRVVWLFKGRRLKARFENFYVIRNGRDLVTHLPPWLFGYRHVGKMISLEDKKSSAIDAHRPESYFRALLRR